MTNPRYDGNQSSNLPIKLLSMAFSIGIAFGSGGGYGFYKYMAANPNMLSAQQNISRVEYERLRLGLSVFEVETILGPGVEIQSSSTSATYAWQNSDKSEIVAVFENGQLYSKRQSGLK